MSVLVDHATDAVWLGVPKSFIGRCLDDLCVGFALWVWLPWISISIFIR